MQLQAMISFFENYPVLAAMLVAVLSWLAIAWELFGLKERVLAHRRWQRHPRGHLQERQILCHPHRPPEHATADDQRGQQACLAMAVLSIWQQQAHRRLESHTQPQGGIDQPAHLAQGDGGHGNEPEIPRPVRR